MFNIPSFHKMDLTWEEAVSIIKIDGNILKGMEHVQEMYSRYDDCENFFDQWYYEANAYNIVFAGFNKLFNGE